MNKKQIKLTNIQNISLVALRVSIGWHFLYEGLMKVSSPNWSSVGYLSDSEGFLKAFYHWLASNPDRLAVVDFANIWGLIAIGTGLMLGLFSRAAIWSGIVLLSLYYLSHPPYFGLSYDLPMEGSYFLVNKILIELIALVVVMLFPTNRNIGFDRLIFGEKEI